MTSGRPHADPLRSHRRLDDDEFDEILLALLAIGGALVVLGNGFVVPVLLASVIVGVVAHRQDRTRHLATGWVAASVATFVGLIVLVVLDWTGVI